LESKGTAGSAWIAADAGDIYGDQRHAGWAVVFTEYEPSGSGESMPELSGGIWVSDFEWELDTRGRADTVAEKIA
jgi:hypothetical protein